MKTLRLSFLGMKLKSLPLALAALSSLLPAVNPAFAQNWTPTSAPITNWTSVASSADGRKLVATADGAFPSVSPIYISTNSGATWTTTSAPVTNWSAVAPSADGTKLVAVGKSGVYTSADSGASWTATGGPAQGHLASSADGTKLVMARVGGYGVFGSTNSGATWTQLPVGGSRIASSADGTKLVAAYFVYNGPPA